MRRRLRRGAGLALVVAGVLGAVVSAVIVWRAARTDRDIAALAAGRDIAVSGDAHPRLLAARGRFLIAHDHVEQAQGIADLLARRDDEAARASLLVSLGDAHLAAAMRSFARDPIRVIAPAVQLAKSEYRQAITLDPGDWDARYDYDLAAGLVRDVTTIPPSEGHEMSHERAVWPDAAGAPNGMP